MTIRFNKKGLESYAIDKDREAHEGVWMPAAGGIRILILRAGGSNYAFTRAFQKMIRPIRKQVDAGTLDPEKSDSLLRRVYAEYVMRDWEGVTDEDGNRVPYTPDAGEAFLETFPVLFDEMQTVASEAATFQEQSLEEAKEILGEG